MTRRAKAQLRLNRTSEFTDAHYPSKNYDLIIRINCNFTLNIFDNLLLIRPQYGQNMEVSMIKCDHYEF